MRKWQDKAAPDDQESYYDVDALIPTDRGTYETADSKASATTGTATSVAGTLTVAFAAPLTAANATYGSTVVYACDSNSDIWQKLANGTWTKRSGSVTAGAGDEFAQYGDVTIIARGAQSLSGGSVTPGADTIFAVVGSNFAALADAPDASLIAVQSNCVLLFDTENGKDGWSASDVGDYTNWTTGEAASGRIIDTPGKITAAVAFAGSVFVFKSRAIYRMTYVGGLIKWRVDKVWDGLGADSKLVCAGQSGILFASSLRFYWFDGTSPPVHVNEFTTIGNPGRIVYSPLVDTFTVWDAGPDAYYYSPVTMAWGKHTDPFGGASSVVIERGNVSTSATTTGYSAGTDLINTYSTAAAASSCYVETSKVGSPFNKIQVSRVTPILRSRSGSGSVAAVIKTFREREDTSAQVTSASITESTMRKRFDVNYVDNYVRAKVTYTDLDVEIDDVVVTHKPAGEN